MKIRFALIAITVVLGWTGAYGQSSAEIEIKYGKRVDVYSVGELLWMTPSYDILGQVCKMRVYPKIVSPTTNYLGANLDINATIKFMNELFPIHTRGARSDFFGMSILMGGVAATNFNYENVHFVFISSLREGKFPPKGGETVLLDDFPFDEAAVAEYRRQKAMKTDDDLIREHAISSRVLEITWANRKCVEQRSESPALSNTPVVP
jgi:hypothetical protein